MPRINQPISEAVYESSFNNKWVNMYETFKNNFTNPKRVLYPSCGTDISPSKVFSNITYVDVDQACINTLIKDNLEAYCINIDKFVPNQKFDLLILLNPAISSYKATKHLADNGYVIANNYHSNAKELFDDDNFSLQGIIKLSDASLDADFNGLFEQYESVDELRETKPEKYDYFYNMFKCVLVDNMGLKISSPEELFARADEMQLGGLPYKKGPDDDFYVFKKISSTN
ncbi:MAG: hypothetical protein WC307_05730 [Candidatus Nanoarchaeia archaeon]|jgi:hypothetical protein